MANKRSKLLSAIATIALVGGLGAVQAAPLANDTPLGIDAGNGGGVQPCTAGSCFSMEIFTGTFAWVDVAPGYDGGIAVGRNQASGGQELTPPGESLPDTGDMTAAWSFFQAWGTFFADNSQNVFSDTSNDGATALNDFNVAWNGSVIPMGGGTINDYTITLDSNGNGTWSLDYSQVVCCGNFTGVPFRLFARGVVTEPPICNSSPVVNDIAISGHCYAGLDWFPSFTAVDCYGTPLDVSCAITSQAANGIATVSPDCSSGTYQSGAGFFGADSFTYAVTDKQGASGTGTVFVSCVYDSFPFCDNNQVRQITTTGGGQGTAANATVQTTFTGKITTEAGLTSGGKNSVKICPDTNVDYETTSTVGTALCRINGVAVANTGTLAIGDKLICTNKPDGSDTDRFSVKNGD